MIGVRNGWTDDMAMRTLEDMLVMQLYCRAVKNFLVPEGCAGGAGSWAVEGWGPPVRFVATKPFSNTSM